MAIKQIAYYVPPEIEAGLIKGIYKQFGGVIRNKKTGAIVKHLDEVPIKKDNALIGAVKNHPVAAVTIGAVIAGGLAWKKVPLGAIVILTVIVLVAVYLIVPFFPVLI